ncbi:MAG: HNH endonuclease [Frankiaceae bacterium]|nr:HNH endonuclease [Frankiaceae bacterium]
MSDSASPYRRPSKVTDEELLAAALEAKNMRELLQSLGIAAYGGNYESIRKRLADLGGIPERFLPRRLRVAPFAACEIDLAKAVASSTTKAEILRSLGYQARPGLYRALNEAIEAAGIETQHLIPRGWSRGLTLPPRTALQDLLRRGSLVQTNYLRQRLLREGVFDHRCDCCGLSEWNGQPIPLELDHIDGDRTNNEIENLRLLCPNCHAQTATYRGRNVGRPHGLREAEAPYSENLRSHASRRLAGILPQPRVA